MRRLPALTLALAAGLATLTACGSSSDDATAASTAAVSTVTVTASPSTVIETTVETAPAPDTQPDTTVADAAPAGSDVCAAATQESLLAALRASPDFDRRVANPSGFRRIQCSAPFALGSTAGTVQSSGVLFRRDGSAWTVLDVGSAMQCAQYGVTAANALSGCVV